MKKSLLSALTLALLLAGCSAKPHDAGNDGTRPQPTIVEPPQPPATSQGIAPPETSAQPAAASE